MKNLFVKLYGTVASFALMITALNANINCIAFIHQPKLPEGAKSLRRF